MWTFITTALLISQLSTFIQATYASESWNPEILKGSNEKAVLSVTIQMKAETDPNSLTNNGLKGDAAISTRWMCTSNFRLKYAYVEDWFIKQERELTEEIRTAYDAKPNTQIATRNHNPINGDSESCGKAFYESVFLRKMFKKYQGWGVPMHVVWVHPRPRKLGYIQASFDLTSLLEARAANPETTQTDEETKSDGEDQDKPDGQRPCAKRRLVEESDPEDATIVVPVTVWAITVIIMLVALPIMFCR